MKQVYVGILAGGIGERLWPLSSQERPKQFIPFLNDYSLLEKTVARITAIPGIVAENIFVITRSDQLPLVQALVGHAIGFIIEEPDGRNTAPAILLACKKIEEKNSEATIMFVPADHFIPDESAFSVSVMHSCIGVKNSDSIALLGLKPTYPSTGYGYIEVSRERAESCRYYAIKQFHEKPTEELAIQYLNNPNMYWNLGIFIGQVAAFKKEFITHAPELYSAMEKYVSGKLEYTELPSISIDYAVMEKSSAIILFEATFTWYDVGTIRTFIQLREQYSGVVNPVLTIKGANNLADTSKKKVVCVGVSDLCIIESGDSLLIVHKDALEDVKQAALLAR